MLRSTNGGHKKGTGPSGKVSNCLTQRQIIQLASAMQKNLADLQGERMDWTKAADYLGKIVGFKVAEANVKSAAKAIDAKWDQRPQRVKKPRLMNSHQMGIAALHVSIAQLANLLNLNGVYNNLAEQEALRSITATHESYAKPKE